MLKQVKKNEHLYWPDNVAPRDTQYRGGAGYVVDDAAPCEAAFLKGQEHKLEAAPDGAVASPITLPYAQRLVLLASSKPSVTLPSVNVPKKRATKPVA